MRFTERQRARAASGLVWSLLSAVKQHTTHNMIAGVGVYIVRQSVPRACSCQLHKQAAGKGTKTYATNVP